MTEPTRIDLLVRASEHRPVPLSLDRDLGAFIVDPDTADAPGGVSFRDPNGLTLSLDELQAAEPYEATDLGYLVEELLLELVRTRRFLEGAQEPPTYGEHAEHLRLLSSRMNTEADALEQSVFTNAPTRARTRLLRDGAGRLAAAADALRELELDDDA